jgi:hypothetical protein
MKKNFTLLLLLIVSVYLKAQTICGNANEGGSVTLTAPPGNIILSINFASYGTPNGSCGSFTIGACHALTSALVCSAAFVGQNSATVNATNAVFGDPCVGTGKRLYVEATYGSILPLTLISFTSKKIEQDKVILNWRSDHEMNSSYFVIERSEDAVLFEATGSVTATGNGGSYSFTDIISASVSTYYYRLKMVDSDGRTQYSNIVRINNTGTKEKLSVFPNPSNNFITISSGRQQQASVLNNTGQLIQKIVLINGSQTINVAAWDPGLYFIKTEESVLKFIKN